MKLTPRALKTLNFKNKLILKCICVNYINGDNFANVKNMD